MGINFPFKYDHYRIPVDISSRIINLVWTMKMVKNSLNVELGEWWYTMLVYFWMGRKWMIYLSVIKTVMDEKWGH